jgi:hypothetical protein
MSPPPSPAPLTPPPYSSTVLQGFYGGGCGFYCGCGSEADRSGRRRTGELAWVGVPKLGLGGVAKLQTEHPRTSCGCWDLPGVLGCWGYCDYWGVGVTAITGVLGLLWLLGLLGFWWLWILRNSSAPGGGQTPPNHMGLNPITYSR